MAGFRLLLIGNKDLGDPIKYPVNRLFIEVLHPWQELKVRSFKGKKKHTLGLVNLRF